MCRVSFKAHSHTAFKDGPPSTHFSRMVRHPHSCWMYCHPHEALFNLDVGHELFEIVRRAGRLRAFADLNGEMSERSWVHWMVFGGSFYFIPSAHSVLIVAPSVWIWAHPLSTHLVIIVDGSSACCVRALPGTQCPHESRQELRTKRHTPWMLEVSAVSIRCLRADLLCFPRQISLFSGFHDSLSPYSCEERQVASARILVFQWRRRE